jgi:hypothetical protein
MSATKQPTRARAVCGKWMPKAQASCGRKPLHPGKGITAQALKQQVDNRPRMTARKVGVRDPDGPARWRRAYKFNRLGITEEQFHAMLEAQGHACGICQEPFEEGQRICHDHDHACCPPQPDRLAKTCGKCIRGLLCVRCNTRIEWVQKYGDAIEAYLSKARSALPGVGQTLREGAWWSVLDLNQRPPRCELGALPD